MERRLRVAFIVAAAIAPAVAAGCDDNGRAATCTDRLHNGQETGMDCGGPCPPCGNGWGCMTNADCASGRCSSEGVCVECIDAAHCPAGGECVAQTCDDGECGFANLPAGTPCGSGLVCNAMGACVGCVSPADCPGEDAECRWRTCDDGACGFALAPPDTPVSVQTPRDCREAVCDGAGGVEQAPDDGDLPVDGNDCTADVCTAGIPSNPSLPAGTPCGSGLVCNAMGACVGCVSPADCPGEDAECRWRTCDDGACGFALAPPDTPISVQTPRDCRENRCDGAGNVTSAVDDTDLPVDGNDCTLDVCTAGAPSNPPEPARTACATGGMCDGAGSCVECLAATDCPGTDTECRWRTCTAGACGSAFAPPDTPISVQTPGDCRENRCDGAGNVTISVDDTDLPVDGDDCTRDVCTAGAPSNPLQSPGMPCGTAGVCDEAGACVGCLSPTDCPGADTECRWRVCAMNVCGFAFAPPGTPLTLQTAGDCREAQCDGAGGIAQAPNDTDLPADGNECTLDVCTGGVPSNPPEPARTACGAGGMCDDAGNCVECLAATDCAGADTECRWRACTAGACGFAFAPAGTPVASQTPRDCRENRCDGAGNVTSAVDDTDLPVDGLQCTRDVCTAGTPSNPPAADGKPCTDDGGHFCRGGFCLPGSIVVVRVGDGSAALSSAATPVFLEQRNLSGVLIRTVPLPTAVSGTNQPLTLSGSATSEGNLTLAATGAFLALAGYVAEPGFASVATATASAVNRVVGRIGVDFVGIDTSTRFSTAFSTGNVRGAATSDGSAFWAAGSTSGTWYIPFGATGGARILTTPDNARFVHVYAGQLYGSSGSGTFTNVFTIGAGLPTTAGQTAASLPGMPTSSASPYAFALLDRSPGVPGVDTLYVADDRSAASGGGVQKWTFDGATWTLAATFTGGLAVGFRGLAALVTGADVTLVAASTATPSALLLMVDDGSPTPAATTLATAAANTAYRGVSFFAR